MDVLRELRGLPARQEAYPHATRRRDVWPERLRWCPENYINQERFRHRQNKADRLRGFTENPHCRLCVCAFQPSPTRSYSSHTYISCNKKRSRLYFYTSEFLLFFLVYNTSILNIDKSLSRSWIIVVLKYVTIDFNLLKDLSRLVLGVKLNCIFLVYP